MEKCDAVREEMGTGERDPRREFSVVQRDLEERDWEESLER